MHYGKDPATQGTEGPQCTKVRQPRKVKGKYNLGLKANRKEQKEKLIETWEWGGWAGRS